MFVDRMGNLVLPGDPAYIRRRVYDILFRLAREWSSTGIEENRFGPSSFHQWIFTGRPAHQGE